MEGPLQTPKHGPVAAYSFDEGEGTTVEDVTGDGHTAMIEGAEWTPLMIVPPPLISAAVLPTVGRKARPWWDPAPCRVRAFYLFREFGGTKYMVESRLGRIGSDRPASWAHPLFVGKTTVDLMATKVRRSPAH